MLNVWNQQQLQPLWEVGISLCRNWMGRDFLHPEYQKDAEDLVQESVCELWVKEANGLTFTMGRKWYLRGIVKNKLKLWSANRKKVRASQLSATQLDLAGEDTELTPYRERYQRLQQAFQDMAQTRKTECEALLKDSFLTQMNDREIAEIFGWAVDYVRQKRIRCLKYLRSLFSKTD